MMKSKRILSVLLIVFFIAALTVSLAFVVQETDHCCTGSDCAICQILNTAEDILGNGKDEQSASTAAEKPIYGQVSEIVTEYVLTPPSTPVTLNDLLTI